MSAAPAPGPRSLLARLEAQRDAREFLIRAVSEGRASHAYLFVGPPGAGKLDAAWALAQALVCPEDGCGACDACVRVARRTHPDVRDLAPESVTGYLVGQVRSVIEDVALAPIRAGVKVYILDRADRLRADSANALLKTLEEPPENVVFILLSSSVEAVLPTVASRCQCVPFRTVPSDVAIAAVERATGQPRAR